MSSSLVLQALEKQQSNVYSIILFAKVRHLKTIYNARSAARSTVAELKQAPVKHKTMFKEKCVLLQPRLCLCVTFLTFYANLSRLCDFTQT